MVYRNFQNKLNDFTRLLCQNGVRFSFQRAALSLKSALFWHKILLKIIVQFIFSFSAGFIFLRGGDILFWQLAKGALSSILFV